MYITQGHFLSPFVAVLKDGEQVGRLVSVDTDLMVGIRIVGFDSEDGLPITDLVKVDEIVFVTGEMPVELMELLPKGFRKVDSLTKEKEQ